MKRYTDSGERHDERGLKHRAVKTTRIVPIPPELVSILREPIEQHGVASMPPEAAERAGHGVDVLLKVYAKCIDGQRGSPAAGSWKPCRSEHAEHNGPRNPTGVFCYV
ncbi:hypothetical protein ACWCOT_04410 [Nonomuraea bangladeshensis]